MEDKRKLINVLELRMEDESVRHYWKRVFCFFRRNNKLFEEIYPEESFDLMLDQLLELGCPDLNVVMRILKLYSVKYWKQNPFFEKVKKTVTKQAFSPLEHKDILRDNRYLNFTEMTAFSLKHSDSKLAAALVRYSSCDFRPKEFLDMESSHLAHCLGRFW